MTYNFMHYFRLPGMEYYPFEITDEEKLEIAKRKAVTDLAKELLKNAVFKIDAEGNVRGTLEIS